MRIKSHVDTVKMSRPIQLAWTQSSRRSRESGMDLDSSVYLRCFLSVDFAKANSWSDLVAKLSAKGFYLKFDQNRLILVNKHTDVDLCTCRYLGFAFVELAKTLGKPRVHGETGRIIASPQCGYN